MSNELDNRMLAAREAAFARMRDENTKIWERFQKETDRIERVCRMLELLEKQPNMKLKYGDDDRLEPEEAHGIVNGYHCLMKRHWQDEGEYAWYVEIPRDHPWYGDDDVGPESITWHEFYPAPWKEIYEQGWCEKEWWVGQASNDCWHNSIGFEEAFDHLKELVDLLIANERREA